MLLELLAGGGGVFSGLIGNGISAFVNYKNKKLDHSHELAMADKRDREMQNEVALAKLQGEQALVLEQEAGANASLQAALGAEASITGTSQWVADLRGSVRPILTYALSLSVVALVALGSNHEQLPQLIYLASTAVTFWFGSRTAKREK